MVCEIVTSSSPSCSAPLIVLSVTLPFHRRLLLNLRLWRVSDCEELVGAIRGENGVNFWVITNAQIKAPQLLNFMKMYLKCQSNK